MTKKRIKIDGQISTVSIPKTPPPPPQPTTTTTTKVLKLVRE